MPRTPESPKPRDPGPDVDESNDESFPASDPPSWTPTRSEPQTHKPPQRKDPDRPKPPKE